MKKIAFSDKYGLTNAVIQGHKTMTRRIINGDYVSIKSYSANCDWHFIADTNDGDSIELKPNYQIGEEIAIAQSYNDIFDNFKGYKDKLKQLYKKLNPKEAAWNNKMFVKASMMPHRIIITDINVEHLQDISDEDCLKEGIMYDPKGVAKYGYRVGDGKSKWYRTPKDAFSIFIDRICGRGTWERNPWVFAYSFKVKRASGF